MSHVSINKISNKLREGIWNKLILVFSGVFKSSFKDGEVFLFGLLTDTEKEMLSKRLVASWMLDSGWSVLDVSNELKMSTATLYKLSGYISRDGDYAKMLRKYFPGKMPSREQVKSESSLDKFINNMFEGYRERWKLYK